MSQQRAKNGVLISELSERLRWMIDHDHDMGSCLSSAVADGQISEADARAIRAGIWKF